MDECVAKVEAKGGVDSPYAVCYASVVEGGKAKDVAERFHLTSEIAVVLESLSAEPQSETIAIEPFKSIDPSKPLKILPIGKFFRDDRILSIEDARAAEIVKNFEAGLPRYGVAVNIEHGDDPHQPGKVGRVKRIRHILGDGIYADEIEYTETGKKLLADERYDAPSPELVWTLNNNSRYQDPQTGQWHDNVLVGLALTNSPFFGKHVAVFSAKPRRENFMQGDMMMQLKEMIKQMWAMVNGGGGEQPQPQPQPQPQFQTKPGGNMSDPIKPEEFVALKAQAETLSKQLDEFKAKAAEAVALKTKLETAEADGKRLAEEFAAERFIRRTAEFQDMAEEFSSIPAKSEDLGAHLLWLNDADTGDKKEHFVYFKTLIQTVDKALAQSSLFSAYGTARINNDNTDVHPFLVKVKEIQAERFKDKSYFEGFRAAMLAASNEHKDLAAQYVADKQARRV